MVATKGRARGGCHLVFVFHPWSSRAGQGIPICSILRSKSWHVRSVVFRGFENFNQFFLLLGHTNPVIQKIQRFGVLHFFFKKVEIHEKNCKSFFENFRIKLSIKASICGNKFSPSLDLMKLYLQNKQPP